jgi:hypothetical protein
MNIYIFINIYIQGVPKRCIHKVNIPYYNVYTSFWDTLYMSDIINSSLYVFGDSIILGYHFLYFGLYPSRYKKS